MPELRTKPLGEESVTTETLPRCESAKATATPSCMEDSMKHFGTALLLVGVAMYAASLIAVFGVPEATSEEAVKEISRILWEVFFPVGAGGATLVITGLLIRIRAYRKTAGHAPQSNEPAS